jgi:hypothetical protein
MSNNGDVAYDGRSYYFSYEQARAVSDTGVKSRDRRSPCHLHLK